MEISTQYSYKQTGSIAPQLNDSDLKDMGIEIVGDRCRFRHVIKAMGRKARQVQRNKVSMLLSKMLLSLFEHVLTAKKNIIAFMEWKRRTLVR